jgi:uncharacterized protein YjbJ (UPF0337 family)
MPGPSAADKGGTMGLSDKISNKTDELKGQAKEKTGEVTGNEDQQAEGKADQVVADVKQAGEKIKDAFKH